MQNKSLNMKNHEHVTESERLFWNCTYISNTESQYFKNEKIVYFSG